MEKCFPLLHLTSVHVPCMASHHPCSERVASTDIYTCRRYLAVPSNPYKETGNGSVKAAFSQQLTFPSSLYPPTSLEGYTSPSKLTPFLTAASEICSSWQERGGTPCCGRVPPILLHSYTGHICF